MSLVATMATQGGQSEDVCSYVSMKVDDAILPLAKAAAALEGQSVQDFASDVLNSAAAKILGRKPVKRRPPPPRK